MVLCKEASSVFGRIFTLKIFHMGVEKSNMQKNDCCWIHLKDLTFFLYLGVHEAEKKIGQNIKMNLSIYFPYTKTNDDINRTLDYGMVYQFLTEKIMSFKQINLLEFFAEEILNDLGTNFSQIKEAKIKIEKGYVPLKNFPGKVEIEALKNYER